MSEPMTETEALAFLNGGGDVHIDWASGTTDVIAKITHLPTGISIEPNAKEEYQGHRHSMFVDLVEKVKAAQN